MINAKDARRRALKNKDKAYIIPTEKFIKSLGIAIEKAANKGTFEVRRTLFSKTVNKKLVEKNFKSLGFMLEIKERSYSKSIFDLKVSW